MEFRSQGKRVLPIILLLDVSASMGSYGRIEALNESVNVMIKELKEQESATVELALSVITFGGFEGKIELPLTKMYEVPAELKYNASGMTPLGSAMKLAKAMVEDRNIITSSTCRPMVILVSDGGPNDDWKQPFDDFVKNGRSKKCLRLSLGVGQRYNEKILKEFSSNGIIHTAEEAKEIMEFFELVTMTAKEKSISRNPNKTPENLLESYENERTKKLAEYKEDTEEDDYMDSISDADLFDIEDLL